MENVKKLQQCALIYFTLQMHKLKIPKQVEFRNWQNLPVKTIVPITAKTKEQAIAQAKVIAANQDADLAEFRIDLLDFAADSKQVIALGHELKRF
jgi:3-dehydroquinate dehydratase-1